MQKKVVLVGAGINGLIFANLLAKKGYMVKLIESGPSIGGNFKAISVGNNKYDRGLYLPQLTGIDEIDSIFVDGQDVNLRKGAEKDIAGNIFKGVLNDRSLFIDISKNKNLAQRVFFEMSEKYGADASETRSVKKYFIDRFGETAYNEIFQNILQNLVSYAIDDYDVAALKVFHLTRLVIFDELGSAKIKQNDFYNARVAYPNQMTIPDNFISDKTPSVYPKKYGLYNLISGLEKQLLNKLVSIETGVFIKDFEIKDNKINIVKVETKNGIVNYETDHLVWCGNTYALDKLLNIKSNILNKLDPPVAQEVTYVVTKSEPKSGKTYWVWDFDNNPVMRLSFPHNYSSLKLAGNYLIVIEHRQGFIHEDIISYLCSRSLIKKKDILKVDTPKEANRSYYSFTKNNIKNDHKFLAAINQLSLSNFHLCSAKISQNVFYLHDLLTDGYSQLKRNGVLNVNN